MKSRTEQEWDVFETKFHEYTDKKIVLYGIGRGTATLIAKNKGFQFVALMDRDMSNIGKEMYGLPIVSLEEAEKISDMIVISAPETYWEIIYKRIEKSKIPVYFRNGILAYVAERKAATIKEIEEKLKDLVFDSVTENMIMKIYNVLLHRQENKSGYSDAEIDTVGFDSLYNFGYCLWGPIVYVFCEWLYEQSKERDIRQLIFLSRDGYLLQQDYDFFIHQYNLDDAPMSQYLLISRRIAFVAAIETLRDFQEWAYFPFNGTFTEYMWNRFMVDVSGDEQAQSGIQMPHDKETISPWIEKYKSQIESNIKRDKGNYKKYLDKMGMQNDFALVDIGYTGNIQRKLSRVMKRQLTGLYFVCDLSPENECLNGNELTPCFQKKSDNRADETAIYRKPQLLEAMFTAPYGMVMAVDEHSEKICMHPSGNQVFFEERLEINRGIQAFIHDMGHSHYKKTEITEYALTADRLFGILLNSVSINEEIEKIFYWEDAVVQTRENMIFQ